MSAKDDGNCYKYLSKRNQLISPQHINLIKHYFTLAHYTVYRSNSPILAKTLQPMIGAFIVFLLIFILPYLVYFNSRYRKSNDKNVFLKDNLYQSTLWITLLVLIPIIIVNGFFEDEKLNEKSVETSVSKEPKQKRDYQILKDSLFSDIDFQYEYVTSLSKKKVINQEFIKNTKKYYDHVAELGYSDNARWAWGTFLYQIGKVDSALVVLNTIENDSLKYLNLTLGNIYKKKGEDSLMTIALTKEISINNGAKKLAATLLIQSLAKSEDYQKLSEVLHKYDLQSFFQFELRKKTLFMSGHIMGYYQMVINNLTVSINPIGIIAALLILIVWLSYIIKLSFFDKINWPILLSVLLFGICTTLLTFLFSDTLKYFFGLWNQFESSLDLLIYSIFGIGAVEELVKIIPLLVLLAFYKHPLKPYEYILYASVSALGFAFLENLLYFEGDYGTIIHGRALTAAVGHMMDSSIFAYGLVLAKYKYSKLNSVVAFFLFWLLASIAHGLYDYWLFENLLLFFVFYFFLLSRIWVSVINNSINNSPSFSYSKGFSTSSLQFYLAFSLTAILMFEYLAVAFQEGALKANSSLFSASFSGSFLILFLGSKLSSINLIKNHWSDINYSINPFTSDIITQNLVGEKVDLSTYYADQGLVEYFPVGVKGLILQRVVLLSDVPNFWQSKKDPNWFLIKLSLPIKDGIHVENKALIKFKEAHSSLNDLKFFHAQFLLIPKKMSRPKMMRKNYKSLGWVFLRHLPVSKKA
jgi:RsiW-degrading membrane proteinase PrsW (M82 family)